MKEKTLGVMLDCSRNAVMTVESVKRFMLLLKKFGYNMLQLYTEDVYEIDGEPYFGYFRGRYGKEELKAIVKYGEQIGVEVMPCIQTLAHLGTIFRWKPYSLINDFGDILLAEEEKTYELIDKMFQTLSECFLSRRVNIGMDEAHMVGLGKYLDKHGYLSRFQILKNHLEKVIKIAEKYHFKPMMWSDMFFKLANQGEYYKENPLITEEVIDSVPSGVELIYWDYYSKEEKRYDAMIRAHKKFGRNFWFAGGAWTWVGFTPNNAFSIDAGKAAVQSCLKNNVNDLFVTLWGDDGAECSYFSVLPSLYAFAKFSENCFDMEKIKKDFLEITGIEFDAMMLLDAPGTVREQEIGFENPSKYMLYNDCFMGIFDSTVIGGEGKYYNALKKKLNEYKNHVEYGYLFQTQAALCSVLEYKYEIGVRTRKAYREKDTGALKILCKDYEKIIRQLKSFYKSFCEQWKKENKTFGLEVQQTRLGGLIYRMEACRSELSQYIEGKIDSIEELEQEILDIEGKELLQHKSTVFNKWSQTVTVNNI